MILPVIGVLWQKLLWYDIYDNNDLTETFRITIV